MASDRQLIKSYSYRVTAESGEISFPLPPQLLGFELVVLIGGKPAAPTGYSLYDSRTLILAVAPEKGTTVTVTGRPRLERLDSPVETQVKASWSRWGDRSGLAGRATNRTELAEMIKAVIPAGLTLEEALRDLLDNSDGVVPLRGQDEVGLVWRKGQGLFREENPVVEVTLDSAPIQPGPRRIKLEADDV